MDPARFDARQLTDGASMLDVQMPEIGRLSPHGPYIADRNEWSVWDYWRTILKHRWVIVAVFLVVTTLAIIATLRMTPIYEAVGRIAINHEEQNVLPFKDGGFAGGSYEDDSSMEIETQVKILQSEALAIDVVKQLRLDRNPAFTGRKATASNSDPLALDLDTLLSYAGRVRGGLTVVSVPRTRIVEIRYASPNPALAAEIANGVINAYIERNIRSHFESTTQASDWLAKQLTDLRTKVETSQQALVDYQQRNQILGEDEKKNITTTKLDDLNTELTRAETERIQREANYRLAESGDPELIMTLLKGGADTSTTLGKLHDQYVALQVQKAQLATSYGPSHPRMLELQNQIDQVQSEINGEMGRVKEQLKSAYLASLAREKMLRGAFEQQKVEANRLNENAIRLSLLRRDAETSRELYNDLLTRLKEAQIAAGLRSSNIRVVDPARAPGYPARPNRRVNISLGMLFGLLGGIGLAFVLESLDNTVRTPDDVQIISGIPALAMIPLDESFSARSLVRTRLSPGTAVMPVRERQSLALVAHVRPNSQMAEAYRALRTSLLLSSPGHPPKAIVISSALPQEGKSTTSVNTAVVLAQMGSKVLLVDADLRRPSLHHLLRLRNSAGLSTLLASGGDYHSLIATHPEMSNLDILPAGPPPPHPAELLSSNYFQRYLNEWREQYQHIIIDTPPMLSVTDGVIASVYADAVVLVVRSGRTTKNALRQLRSMLTQVNTHVVGILINGVDLNSPTSYYYYAYSYARTHGHYYGDESNETSAARTTASNGQ